MKVFIALVLAAMPAFSEGQFRSGMQRLSLIQDGYSLPVTNGDWDLDLGNTYCVEKVEVAVRSFYGEATAYLKAGTAASRIIYASQRPGWISAAVGAVSDKVTLEAVAMRGRAGLIQFDEVIAHVTHPDSPLCRGHHGAHQPSPRPIPLPPGAPRPGEYPREDRMAFERRTGRRPVPCDPCGRVGIRFPTYHANSVMANVAQEAIFLVDELMGYTNYRDLGMYLLPIKKAAAHARAMGERWGDASGTAAVSYRDFLMALDEAEGYIDENFERGYVFNLAQDLLSLREYIRRVLT